MNQDHNPVSEEQHADPHFETGDIVVIRGDFHNRYFRNRVATVIGKAENSGTSESLWQLSLDVAPGKAFIPGKYLLLKSEADKQSAQAGKAAPSGGKKADGDGTRASNGASKSSFLTRFIPWKK